MSGSGILPNPPVLYWRCWLTEVYVYTAVKVVCVFLYVFVTGLCAHWFVSGCMKPMVQNKARDSEWQWHQQGHMQVCTLLQTDNHTSTPPLFFTGRMPFLPPNQQRQSTEGNKTKQQQTEYQWIRHAFLSQSTFGSDISNDMLPPTLRNKGCRVLLIVSASVTARWSIHIITLHRSSPTKVENFTDI